MTPADRCPVPLPFAISFGGKRSGNHPVDEDRTDRFLFDKRRTAATASSAMPLRRPDMIERLGDLMALLGPRRGGLAAAGPRAAEKETETRHET